MELKFELKFNTVQCLISYKLFFLSSIFNRLIISLSDMLNVYNFIEIQFKIFQMCHDFHVMLFLEIGLLITVYFIR